VDACNQTASFQEVQIPVRRRVTERRVASQVGLVEEFAGSLRGQHHHALKIRQAGDSAQLAQITLQMGLYISPFLPTTNS